MAFRKKYVVSTEDVNSYGFVTLTSGIDINAAKDNCPAYIDHNYWELPIGHWEDIKKEGSKLTAVLVIEGENEREREVIRKIENGDMKGASIGADPVAWDDSPLQLVKGQTKATLSKSDLFEISVTALPSNKSALCLKREGNPVKLNATNAENLIPNLKTTQNMKAIALKLGLPESASENEIIAAIEKVQLSKANAEGLTKEILDKAAEGLDEKQKEIFVTLSMGNAKQAIAYAESVKTVSQSPDAESVEKATTKLTKDVKVSDLINKGVTTNSETGKDSFDYLSKHNTVELNRIRLEEPEKYAQLARDYRNGVRYAGKTA